MMKIFGLLLLILAVYSEAQEHIKKKIFILHSYSQEYGWTKSQNDAFIRTLKTEMNVPLTISVEYLDTKRLKFTDEYQEFFLRYLQTKYEGYTPDIIYVSDDNALQFFVKHKKNLFRETPLFFSGVNNLTLADTLDKSQYTGIFENKEIEPNIELIRQFSPQTREIWIVGDDSGTYQAIKSEIENKISQYPNHTFHFVSAKSINDVIQNLPDTLKSFVILTTIGEWCDRNGNNLTLNESINLLTKKKNLILTSMEDAYIMQGVIGGFVTSGTHQGESAARLVLRSLNGEAMNTLDFVEKSPNVYMFDRKALMDSRIILSEYVARNAHILHEEKTFFERYQEVILSVIFILFILFFVFTFIVFLVIYQKNAKLKEIEAKLLSCQENLSDKVTD
ncbi:MAG: ABC transporter substrate binding protein [Sulfuricurvum sp.]|nr:ABC transporter substrate binding protein [Sulfuricurvum sp.]